MQTKSLKLLVLSDYVIECAKHNITLSASMVVDRAGDFLRTFDHAMDVMTMGLVLLSDN